MYKRKADAIDREAEVHQAIERMRPNADILRAAIAGLFTAIPLGDGPTCWRSSLTGPR